MPPALAARDFVRERRKTYIASASRPPTSSDVPPDVEPCATAKEHPAPLELPELGPELVAPPAAPPELGIVLTGAPAAPVEPPDETCMPVPVRGSTIAGSAVNSLSSATMVIGQVSS